jgi:general nucleoside transport system permease protein
MTKNSRWVNIGFQIAALALALLFTTLILLAAGAPPLEAYKNIVIGAFGSF